MRPRSLVACLLSLGMVLAAPAGAASAADRPVAVIGDFGDRSPAEAAVAGIVLATDPVAVVTTGDNIYDSDDYGRSVGAFYCGVIADAPPTDDCPSASMARVNAFFPAAGNHDWREAGIDRYRAYFAAARQRTSYAVTVGSIEFLVLDSEAVLRSAASTAWQRAWVRARARSSSAAWQVVVLHHPPYSSGTVHGSSPALRWPFRAWGVDLVLTGHEHQYERLQRDGLTYVVNGSGGAHLYAFGAPIAGSRYRNGADHGAVLLRATPQALRGEFRTTTGRVVDRFIVRR